ncbi:MAG: HEAT repeat domain-containing protein [Methanosarcinaceae archaeon]
MSSIDVATTETTISPYSWGADYLQSSGTVWPTPERRELEEENSVYTYVSAKSTDLSYLWSLPTEQTQKVESTPAIDEVMIKIFKEAVDEIFEDGVKSVFIYKLFALVESFGIPIIQKLMFLILDGQINFAVASESLRWLGDIPYSDSTYRVRLLLLSKCIFHSSPLIRDGAILGFSFLDDPITIPILKEAYESEAVPELKKDIHKIIALIEA